MIKKKSKKNQFPALDRGRAWTPRLIEKLFHSHHLQPRNRQLIELKQEVIDRYLQRWHIPMLSDIGRNSFFLASIKSKVFGKLVLDIGCGTGLLSLMAAKYGAKHVYACESNPLLYVIAKEIIGKSPFRNKITLFHCHSEKLSLGLHLPERVDIIVSEIFSSDIFSEEMISVFADSKRLLKKDGIFLPERLEVYSCLIDFDQDPATGSTGSFMSSELNDFLGPRNLMIQLHKCKHKVISDIKMVKSIELLKVKQTPFPFPISLTRNDKVAKNPYLCVFFKLFCGELELSSFISNSKSTVAQHWGQVIYKTDFRKQYRFEANITKKSKLTILQF